MARITKSRARSPIAKGRLGRSWGKDTLNGEVFTLHVQGEDTPNGDATFHSLKLDRNEMFTVVQWAAPFLATAIKEDPYGMHERKGAAAALRELADLIDDQRKG